MDASLLANEIIDSMIKRKEKGILCKLDIEKAYDQINWNRIIKVLQKMGFGAKWVSWIKWCISTSFSVLINGSTAGFFNNSRGLRQGDPLSLYLFVIGMEVFSILVDKAASGGFSIRLQYYKQKWGSNANHSLTICRRDFSFLQRFAQSNGLSELDSAVV